MKKVFCILSIAFCLLPFAYLNAQTWNKVPGNLKPHFRDAMVVYNNKLYISMANPDSVDQLRILGIARFDGAQWDTVGPGVRGVPLTLGVYNNELYAGGGNISLVNDGTVGNILRWDNNSWKAAQSNAQDDCYRIYSMAEYKGELYVGGQFNKIGGKTVSNIARWNGTTWNSVGGGIGGGFDEVDAMAVYNGELYVAGIFGVVGGALPANNVARWNGTKWDSVAGGILGGIGAMITDTVKNILYVVGGVWQSGNKQLYGAAQWDGNTWDPLGNDTMPGGGALCIYRGELYSGGGGQRIITVQSLIALHVGMELHGNR